MVATGRAGAGVLIRDAEALERLAAVDTLVVDKTGTLTAGQPTVTDISAGEGLTETDVLAWLQALERASEHPLAGAILRKAEEVGVPIHDAEGFEAIVGRGLRGDVDGKRLMLGNESFLKENGIDTTHYQAEADAPEGRQDRRSAVGGWTCGGTDRGIRSRQTEAAAIVEAGCPPTVSGSSWQPEIRKQRHRPWRPLSESAPFMRHNLRGQGGAGFLCRRKGAGWRWPGTVSTIPRHWQLPMSGSPWAAVPMSGWSRARVLPPFSEIFAHRQGTDFARG